MIPLAAHSRRTCILYVAHILSHIDPYIPLNLPYKLRDNQLHITPSARFYCGHIPIVLQCPRLSTWELPIYTLVFAYILLSRYIESSTCLYLVMLSCANTSLYRFVLPAFGFSPASFSGGLDLCLLSFDTDNVPCTRYCCQAFFCFFQVQSVSAV